MDQSLESLLERLKREDALAECGEEVIRQGAVLPILGQLGWNWDNVREVTPEFSAGKGRVDYCLTIAGRPSVFMEVKRPLEDLEHHQEQLLEYAFSQGVKMAVLTNGFQWWFYLPLFEGSWEQRKFFAIDIRQQDVAEVAKHFREFLSRQRVADGSAVKLAQESRESAQKSRRIEETIPRAWKELCEAPDERLLDLFADKVESLCGHRPTSDQLAAWLPRTPPPPPPPPKPPKGGKPPGREPKYMEDHRRQLRGPNTKISKIRHYIQERGEVTLGELKEVCVRVWGHRPNVGGIQGRIRVLEADGFIKTQGKGDTKRLIWLK